MKEKWKAVGIACLLLCVLVVAVGCTTVKTPYERNDAENYNVSIKYDANGGFFTTNTSVIVDSYNISGMQTDSDGNARIYLLSPDDQRRGNDAFTAVNNGYFLAGWYAERTETTDAAGNKTYTYGKKWNFDQDALAVDADGNYTSSEPVLTLYAAWVPMFRVEFYDRATGELMESVNYDPTGNREILMPEWSEKTGAIEMNSFPERKGYTFACAYYDPEGKEPVNTATVVHPGAVDEATGTAKNNTLKIYVDWMEGEWFHIYNVDQFLKNASVSGNYVIHADLDFADKTWPTSMMYGNFSGTIQGNGHTFKNIEFEQTNNSKVNAGLFGNLTETASITDLRLENVTFTIKSGSRVSGANFGLFAGSVSEQAVLTGVSVHNSTLKIDSSCYFSTDDYSIGLVCGMGNTAIDASGITCVAAGDHPDQVSIAVVNGMVHLTFSN